MLFKQGLYTIRGCTGEGDVKGLYRIRGCAGKVRSGERWMVPISRCALSPSCTFCPFQLHPRFLSIRTQPTCLSNLLPIPHPLEMLFIPTQPTCRLKRSPLHLFSTHVPLKIAAQDHHQLLLLPAGRRRYGAHPCRHRTLGAGAALLRCAA